MLRNRHIRKVVFVGVALLSLGADVTYRRLPDGYRIMVVSMLSERVKCCDMIPEIGVGIGHWKLNRNVEQWSADVASTSRFILVPFRSLFNPEDASQFKDSRIDLLSGSEEFDPADEVDIEIEGVGVYSIARSNNIDAVLFISERENTTAIGLYKNEQIVGGASGGASGGFVGGAVAGAVGAIAARIFESYKLRAQLESRLVSVSTSEELMTNRAQSTKQLMVSFTPKGNVLSAEDFDPFRKDFETELKNATEKNVRQMGLLRSKTD